MNMVGHKGLGVSSWLSMASSWAFQIWSEVLQMIAQSEIAQHWQDESSLLNNRVNQFFWDDQWYARGMTDQGRLFGIKGESEGRIYLNPQSWSILCGAADKERQKQLETSITEQLETSTGIQMLSPAYTQMIEDIGRLTQKSPGVAENGSVYNHASAFYAYALYKTNTNDKAFEALKYLTTDINKADITGQLPNYVPNYYRGAAEQFPIYTGRSSRLINTGTIAWMMRCVVEELVGLKGTAKGLIIDPKLPSHWNELSAKRRFNEHNIVIKIKRSKKVKQLTCYANNEILSDNILPLAGITSDYHLDIWLPTI